MRIGLIDVDGHNFPNIPLMKISAYHKAQGDTVEWYEPLIHGEVFGLRRPPLDIVYMSKVFSFSPDYEYHINARKIIRGGSGYCITLQDGKEIYDSSKDISLPPEIEHIYPDYSIYYGKVKKIEETAYGFMSRGCPRQCGFCHVKSKPADGKCSHKVADLSEFWRGQKYIELCDPNTLACPDWKDILMQLRDSKAYVNFNQGVDVRMMTPEKAALLKQIKIKRVHFAYDRYQDKKIIEPKLRQVSEMTGWKHGKVTVYVLCNFDTTMEQNLERIYFLRDLDFQPFVMLYDKEHIPENHILKKLQRWASAPGVIWACPTFEEYLRRN